MVDVDKDKLVKYLNPEEFLVKKEVEVADARRIGLVVTNKKDKQKIPQLLMETDTSAFETIPPASSTERSESKLAIRC